MYAQQSIVSGFLYDEQSHECLINATITLLAQMLGACPTNRVITAFQQKGAVTFRVLVRWIYS